MRLGSECVRKLLDNVITFVMVFGDVQLKAGDESVVEKFGLSIHLWVVGCLGEFLQPEERTKRRKEFAYKLGSIVGQKLLQYAIRDNRMVKEY